MKQEALRKAVALAARLGHAFVVTAGAKGRPHAIIASRAALTPENHLAVAGWLCPTTIASLQANPYIGVVVWDAVEDIGYQILGEVEEMKDLGILNRYVPEMEGKISVPQVERQLVVHVDEILEFSQALHSDVEE